MTAILVLEDGTYYLGEAAGAPGVARGEVVFNTNMTGYQEVLTDPSYCGQLVTMTTPHIGNYGINFEDTESKKVQVQGFIIKEDSPIVSNYRATDSLNNYLKSNQIVGIQGIDTRALTRILRIEGAMNGIISSSDISEGNLKKKLMSHPSMNGMDLAQVVTCSKPYNWNSNNQKYKVAAIDYGIKHNILRLIEKEDCHVKVFPASVSSDEILSFAPDGIFLSNGPFVGNF